MADEYDLLIVGGGLAGLTAALYGARYGLRTCLVEQMAAGGQVLNVEKIENFPGFPQGIAGFDLGPIVQEQAEAAGAEFTMDTAIGLDVDGDRRVVRCEGAEFVARSVIVASGSAFRALGIPGETEYVGRGVSHCAACDAPFFVGKDVVVIGGGDSALDEAAVLAAQVRRVTVVHRGASFRAQQVAVDRLSKLSNVSMLFNTEVAEIVGGDTVSSVRLRSIHVRSGGSGGSGGSGSGSGGSGSGGNAGNGGNAGSGGSGGSGSGGNAGSGGSGSGGSGSGSGGSGSSSGNGGTGGSGSGGSGSGGSGSGSGGSGSGGGGNGGNGGNAGNGGPAELALSGVFIFVGLEPNTAWLRGVVDQDAAGHVVVDQHLQTSVAGVFAAGDLRQASSRQLVAAAGDGATAAVFAARYLREGRR